MAASHELSSSFDHTAVGEELLSSISGLWRGGDGRTVMAPSPFSVGIIIPPLPGLGERVRLLRREYLWIPHRSKRDLYARILEVVRQGVGFAVLRGKHMERDTYDALNPCFSLMIR